jgi:hypothetical protein
MRVIPGGKGKQPSFLQSLFYVAFLLAYLAAASFVMGYCGWSGVIMADEGYDE